MVCNLNALISVHSLLKFIQIAIGCGCVTLLLVYHLHFDHAKLDNMVSGNMKEREWDDIMKPGELLQNITDPAEGVSTVRSLVGHTAIGAPLLFSITMIFSYILNQEALGLDAMLCIIGGIISIAGGALAIETYHAQEHEKDFVKAGLGMGSMMVINGVLYFVDTVVKLGGPKYKSVSRY